MILGRVVGHVWATRKDARLARAKLLVIRPHGLYEPAFAARHLIATDDVDAGVGDDVVVCLGQPARLSLGSDDMPVDAAVLGVVERVDYDAAALTAASAGPGIRRPFDFDPARLPARSPVGLPARDGEAPPR